MEDEKRELNRYEKDAVDFIAENIIKANRKALKKFLSDNPTLYKLEKFIDRNIQKTAENIVKINPALFFLEYDPYAAVSRKIYRILDYLKDEVVENITEKLGVKLEWL